MLAIKLNFKINLGIIFYIKNTPTTELLFFTKMYSYNPNPNPKSIFLFTTKKTSQICFIS